MSDADPAERIRHLEADNARLRRLLDQRGVPGTLRHRVRNALGLMRAILRRSAESKSTVEDFVAHVEGRFDALLRVQTSLLSSPDGCADLFTLVADEFLSQTITEDERATISGPTVRLEARQAELLGLVLHELATNAVKFGALTTATGQIDVSWEVPPGPRTLDLTWSERGQHADPHAIHRGFGMEAIEGMLPYQTRAESKVEFLPDGLRCRISMPLTASRE